MICIRASCLKWTFVVCAAVCSLGSLDACAAPIEGLTLHIDTINKEFWHSGFDDVTGNTSGDVGWNFTSVGTVGDTPDLTSLGATVSLDVGMLDSTYPHFNFGSALGGLIRFVVGTNNTNFGAFTVTGTGTKLSYASLDATNLAAFESLIGKTHDSVAGGTAGLDNYTVQSAAIPEPTTLTLIGIGSCLMGGAGWRRRRKQNSALRIGTSSSE